MPKTSKPVPREELYESIERLEDPRNRALVGTLSVLACRVGELVDRHPLRKRDIQDVGERYVFTVYTEKNPKLWLHLFRHSRLTEVAPRMLLLELQAMAGRSSVEPLNNYMHLMESVYAGKIKPWKPTD